MPQLFNEYKNISQLLRYLRKNLWKRKKNQTFFHVSFEMPVDFDLGIHKII